LRTNQVRQHFGGSVWKQPKRCPEDKIRKLEAGSHSGFHR